MAAKKIRAVLLVRNPKDTLVSIYSHIRGFRVYGYDGEWSDWLRLYMRGQMLYGVYSEYLMSFEKAMAIDAGFPIHVVHYEDLKQDCINEIRRLARFLSVEIDDELCARIANKCSFRTMSVEDDFSDGTKQRLLNDGYSYYRKGEVGDWKNWFTVAQNEQFDKYWEKEMAGSKIKFTFQIDKTTSVS